MVLNLETKFYHTLNSTAVMMWKAIGRGQKTKTELAGQLASEFNVGETRALEDVSVAIREFEHEGFLLRRPVRL